MPQNRPRRCHENNHRGHRRPDDRRRLNFRRRGASACQDCPARAFRSCSPRRTGSGSTLSGAGYSSVPSWNSKSGRCLVLRPVGPPPDRRARSTPSSTKKRWLPAPGGGSERLPAATGSSPAVRAISRVKSWNGSRRAVMRIRRETTISPSCPSPWSNRKPPRPLEGVGGGMETYHHNLETAPELLPLGLHHPRLRGGRGNRAGGQGGRARGLCGGIFGLGENVAQRVELALTLRELDVDSVPLQLPQSRSGTRLERLQHHADGMPLPRHRPLHFRSSLRGKSRSAAVGESPPRPPVLDIHGRDGTMVGNYLTTQGRPVAVDRQMISDLELDAACCCE